MKIDMHTGFDADHGDPSRERAPRRVRSLTLGWTDPDTGDRLTAQVRGGEDWLPELEREGFELLAFEPLDRSGSGLERARDVADGPSAPTAIEGEVSVVSELSLHARRHVSRRN